MRSAVLYSFAPAVVALCALSASSCTAGGGDLKSLEARPQPPGNPIANQIAEGKRIANDATLRARGVVVVAVDTYDETMDGKGVGDVFVQDPIQEGAKGTPYSALRLYRPTKAPPDLRLLPGQWVEVVGPFTAFTGPPGSPPFDGGVTSSQVANGALTLVGEGAEPEPVELTYDDVKDPKTAMPYFSRLVRIRNVPIMDAFSVTRPEAPIFTADRNGLKLTSKFFAIHDTKGLDVSKGKKLKSVVGILDFFYTVKLCPRTVADIEP